MADWMDREGEERRDVRVQISDLRHSRDLEAELETEGAEQETDSPEPALQQVETDITAASQLELADAPDTAASMPQDSPHGLLDFPAASTSADMLEQPGHSQSAAEVAAGQEADAHPAAASELEETDLSPEAQAASAQLRQVFALGLSRYLQGQLELLLTFALIGLGRAPDPSTGLLTQNLTQARMAIDVLEFLVMRLEPELHPQDRVQLTQLVADLKYTYLQVQNAGSEAPHL